MRASFLKFVSLLLVLTLLAPASMAPGESDQYGQTGDEEESSDDKWQFSVGLVHQWGARMDVDGPPATLVRRLWGSLPGGSGQSINDQTIGFHPTAADVVIPIDDITQYADRTFDDGFVWIDVWTEDTLQPVERLGTTWNWGYDNASQYDSGDLTLTFHRTTTLSESGVTSDRTDYNDYRSRKSIQRDDDTGASDEISQDGIQFTAQRRLKRWENWDLGLNINVAWFPDSTLEASDTPFEMEVRQDVYRVVEEQNSTYSYEVTYQETYVYGDRFGRLDPLLDSIPVVAPAPYGGGGFNGPGPLIPNLPEGYTVDTISFTSQETVLDTERSESLVDTRYWNIVDQVDVDAELERMRFSCGLRLIREPTNRLHVVIDPKVTLNCIEADVTRVESVVATDRESGNSTVVGESVSSGDKSAVIPGLMLAGGLHYRLTERWYIGGQLSYEWLLEPLEIDMDPDKVTITLDGTELTVYAGRHF